MHKFVHNARTSVNQKIVRNKRKNCCIVRIMTEAKNRLKKARETAGFKTPSAAARTHRSLNVNTLINHENGNSDISKSSAVKYAKAFKVSPGWILFGPHPSEMSDGDWQNQLKSLVSRLLMNGINPKELYLEFENLVPLDISDKLLLLSQLSSNRLQIAQEIAEKAVSTKGKPNQNDKEGS